MTNNLTTKLKIIECLIKADKPLILNHIAKKTKLDIQLVEYHIKIFIKEEVINRAVGDDDKNYYYLVAPFYDKDNMDALYSLLTPYIQETIKTLRDNSAEVTQKGVINTFMYLLFLFIEDIKMDMTDEKLFQ